MSELARFFDKIKYFLLFLLLEVVAFYLTQNNYSVQHSFFTRATGSLICSIENAFSFPEKYFRLKQKNEYLHQENSKLRNLLALKKEDFARWEEYPGGEPIAPYSYCRAEIVKNSFNRQDNYLILKPGALSGIEPGMSVVTPQGVVGTIVEVYPDYSICMSILNRKSSLSVRFEKNNYFGVATWEGRDRRFIRLSDIPRQAPVASGDTILTDARSHIFPEDIRIGTVENFEISPEGNYYQIDIRLLEDMANLKSVYIVRGRDQLQLDQVEERIDQLEKRHP